MKKLKSHPLAKEKKHNKKQIDFNALVHLDSIGLIHFSGLTGFSRTKLPKCFVIYYYGRPLALEMPKEIDNQLDIGMVILTKTGLELAPICGSTAVDAFWDYVSEHWK
jgi:hypothetical protein